MATLAGKLLKMVETESAREGISLSAFGRKVVNDHRFAAKLRTGVCTVRRAQILLDYVKAQEKARAAHQA